MVSTLVVRAESFQIPDKNVIKPVVGNADISLGLPALLCSYWRKTSIQSLNFATYTAPVMNRNTGTHVIHKLSWDHENVVLYCRWS